jgi:hypothetical protein
VFTLLAWAVGLWLAFGLVLSVPFYAMSGWEDLQRQFPDKNEKSLRTLRFRNARLGRIGKSGCEFAAGFCFDLCETGLRIRLLPIFSVACRPFFVPWSSLQIDEVNPFLPSSNVYLGRPAVGTMEVSSGLLRQILFARSRALNLAP